MSLLRLLGLLLAACASAPPIRVALPGPSASVAQRPDPNSGATLLLRQVTLPKYLDSFAVVVDRKANTLVVSDDAEWAESLRDAVTRTLRDSLSQRLGASRVLLRGEHRVADAELVIEFSKLDPSDGILQLDARWSFVCSSRAFPTQRRPHTAAAATRGNDAVRCGFGHRERAGQASRRTRRSNVVRYRQRTAPRLIAARLQRAAASQFSTACIQFGRALGPREVTLPGTASDGMRARIVATISAVHEQRCSGAAAA